MTEVDLLNFCIKNIKHINLDELKARKSDQKKNKIILIEKTDTSRIESILKNTIVYNKYLERISDNHIIGENLLYDVSTDTDGKLLPEFKSSHKKNKKTLISMISILFPLKEYVVLFQYLFAFSMKVKLNYYLIVSITCNGAAYDGENFTPIKCPYVTTFNDLNPKEISDYLNFKHVENKYPKKWLDREIADDTNFLYENLYLDITRGNKSHTIYKEEFQDELKVETFEKITDKVVSVNGNPKIIQENIETVIMQTVSKDDKILKNIITYAGDHPQTYTVGPDNKVEKSGESNNNSLIQDFNKMEIEEYDSLQTQVKIDKKYEAGASYGYKAAKIKVANSKEYQPCIIKLLIPREGRVAFSSEELKIRTDQAIPIKIIRLDISTFSGIFNPFENRVIDDDEEMEMEIEMEKEMETKMFEVKVEKKIKHQIFKNVVHNVKSIFSKIGLTNYEERQRLKEERKKEKEKEREREKELEGIPDGKKEKKEVEYIRQDAREYIETLKKKEVPIDVEKLSGQLIEKVTAGILQEKDIPKHYYMVRYVFEEEHNIAYSCVAVDSFVYEVGKLTTIPDFDGDLTKVCVPGIHYYFRQAEAMSWHGLPDLTPDQIYGVEELDKFKPTFVETTEMS